MEEGRGPRVPRSKGPKVQGSQGPRVPRISKSHSNMSLTLKKVHLVFILVFKHLYVESYLFNYFEFLVLSEI